jgi:hypothetical protein
VATHRFLGACDASAAARIAGTTFFVTASDEDYVLRVYDSAQPGLPVSQLDVTGFLQPVDRKKEPDLEGCAQIGNLVYWVGSHGRDKDGEEQESRQRLFATEVVRAGGRVELRTVGRPYKKLLADLSTEPGLTEFNLAHAGTLKPEDPGGLNIEGLAPTPQGDLLVGFRNPNPGARALIVRILNPEDVIAGTSRAKVRKEALLDLGGRGLRALEPLRGGNYLLLAGRFDDTKDFALFRWDGAATVVRILDRTSISALNPEELLVGAEETTVQLFSDDGEALMGGKKCKKVDEAERAFRATGFNV